MASVFMQLTWLRAWAAARTPAPSTSPATRPTSEARAAAPPTSRFSLFCTFRPSWLTSPSRASLFLTVSTTPGRLPALPALEGRLKPSSTRPWTTPERGRITSAFSLRSLVQIWTFGISKIGREKGWSASRASTRPSSFPLAATSPEDKGEVRPMPCDGRLEGSSSACRTPALGAPPPLASRDDGA